MTHTYIIRSSDRVYGSTSDFMIKMPFLGELARSDYWRVSVQRVLFPRVENYPWWRFVANGFVSFQAQNAQRHAINSPWVEVHLDFGSTCRGHDTAIGGGRVVHFVRGADPAPQDHTLSTGLTLHESKPCDAIPYEIARPNLTELRVQVLNQFGKAAGLQASYNIPSTYTNTANQLEYIEAALPEWWMVVQLEPIEKNINLE